jgi:multidrug resistance efflux pump
MRFNFFYLVVLLLGLSMFFLFKPPAEDELSFFGFAESTESAVNYNYPVVVDRIHIQPGEAVKAGAPLMEVSRRKAKETLADQKFRIAELRAEENIWRQRRENELSQLRQSSGNNLAELDQKIAALQKELAYKRSLAEGLKTIDVKNADYQPLEDEIADLTAERARRVSTRELRESNLIKETRLGNSPFREQIRRLEAEMVFEEDQKVQPFTITAPTNGLVGNINVKEEEHVQSYETLLTFYEPHSSLVRGYVHEDQTARVALGDELEVYSLRPDGPRYVGKVVGLGSRIVETPSRLRKLPDFKTYGREVTVEISRENVFLQKEKVGVRRVIHSAQ